MAGKSEIETAVRHESAAAKPAVAPGVAPVDALAGVVAPAAGIVGAWIAAGSVGLLGHPLSHALTWLALGVVVVAAWPDWRAGMPRNRIAIWLAGIVAAIVMTASSLAPINVMAPALLLAVLALIRPDAQRALRIAALAVAAFGVYRLANTSIPSLWLATDWLGGVLGKSAGWISGQPLAVGATFGGVDFLLLMAAIYALWLTALPAPRWRSAAWGAAGILAAQFVYLVFLSEAPNLLEFLTAKPADDEWFRRWFADLAPWKELLPWNVPLLAAVAQGAIAAVLFQRLRGRTVPDRAAAPAAIEARDADRRPLLLTILAGVAAVMLPMATVLAPFHATLKGKKVISYEHGFLNWEKPRHGNYGQLSVGMYGMLGPLIESLGGSFSRSADLSAADLANADLLILIYPTRESNPPREFTNEQVRRVQEFVERGGKLLLMCEHTVREVDPQDPFHTEESRFNAVLKPTSIRVPFDAAWFAVEGWRESYEALAHPTTDGIGDDRNQFGVVIGASVDARWPARPLLIGRWGYCDHGDEGNGATMAMLGNLRYDAGERLGDVVLAAEQTWGDGRVMVFGDTSSLVNGVAVSAHPFVTRLLAYMAGDGATTQSPLRQTAGACLALLVFVLLLTFQPTAGRAIAVALALAISLAICVAVTAAATEIYPSGEREKPNNLAYIDSAHLGAYSEASDQPDGLFGLEYALMRDDMLVETLYDVNYERLHGAGVFISIGPQRSFTAAERQAIGRFMREGGIFILMAGYERSSASRELLAEYGFTVGAISDGKASDSLPAGTEPTPLGHFKSPYFPSLQFQKAVDRLTQNEAVKNLLRLVNISLLADSDRAYVRFHAAWGITCNDPNAEVIAEGLADRPFDMNGGMGGFKMEGKLRLPVIIVRPVGKGKMVVIGDTNFATNMNLENKDGTPIEGLRENADFWRWFLAKLRGLPEWNPLPNQRPATPLPEAQP